ncbi:hypothetical protein BGY98DRAFT_472928 [Russula aff. rugulosa BPL654]|nr:hypothetical protein BGY98DRAFT_472928 [Russula aff. rugulosa BPL654]
MKLRREQRQTAKPRTRRSSRRQRQRRNPRWKRKPKPGRKLKPKRRMRQRQLRRRRRLLMPKQREKRSKMPSGLLAPKRKKEEAREYKAGGRAPRKGGPGAGCEAEASGQSRKNRSYFSFQSHKFWRCQWLAQQGSWGSCLSDCSSEPCGRAKVSIEREFRPMDETPGEG